MGAPVMFRVGHSSAKCLALVPDIWMHVALWPSHHGLVSHKASSSEVVTSSFQVACEKTQGDPRQTTIVVFVSVARQKPRMMQ